MQRKRNEGGGWQAAGRWFCSETAPSIAKTATKVPGPFVVEMTFAQIEPAKINLSLFGLSLIHI